MYEYVCMNVSVTSCIYEHVHTLKKQKNQTVSVTGLSRYSDKYTHVCMCVSCHNMHAHACMCVRMWSRMHVCMYVVTHACVYVCGHACRVLLLPCLFYRFHLDGHPLILEKVWETFFPIFFLDSTFLPSLT